MNTNKPDQAKIFYRIDSIRKISHFENYYSDMGIDKSTLKKYNFHFGVGLKFDSEEGTVDLLIKTVFFVDVESEEVDLFGVETSHKFRVKDFKKHFSMDECEEYEIPDDLMLAFVSISISGTRSMLATLNSIPDYNEMLLPIINPVEVLKTIQKNSK